MLTRSGRAPAHAPSISPPAPAAAPASHACTRALSSTLEHDARETARAMTSGSGAQLFRTVNTKRFADCAPCCTDLQCNAIKALLSSTMH